MQGRTENKIKTEQKLQEMLLEYPDYLTEFYYALNSKTHSTKLRYILNVVRFLKYLDDQNPVDISDLDKVKTIHINKYIQSINIISKNNDMVELSPASKGCIYSSLNAFFSFLKKNNMIHNNPFDNGRIERPKIQENDVVFLTPDEVKKVETCIMNGCGNARAKGKQKNWRYRDLLLFRIPVVNGLRVTALSEINVSDINMKNKTIKVTEKGNITKNVYFDDVTAHYIKLWLTQREEIIGTGTDCGALFISNQKTRITSRSIENIIGKYTENTIQDKHITPHKLRSTCGTNIYQQTKDIYLVADVLGHKSTAPTRRYTKILNQDKQNAILNVANLYN